MFALWVDFLEPLPALGGGFTRVKGSRQERRAGVLSELGLGGCRSVPQSGLAWLSVYCE